MGFSDYPYPSYNWDYQGIDFAGIPITQALADQMYNDGIRFVGRYLFSRQYPSGKGITAQEAQYYINAGLKIFLYYEVDTTDVFGGYNGGYQNGQTAFNLAVQAGVPQDTQIFCCCDTGVTNAQAQGIVMQYLAGFADAIQGYTPGIYGGANVMDACYSQFPNYSRVQAGAWGMQEFDPINIRQWLIGYNNRALNDGKIRISNITIDRDGYAKWNGHNVDILSANSLANMWGDSSPTPPTPPTPPSPPVPPVEDTSMPIWFYLKKF